MDKKLKKECKEFVENLKSNNKPQALEILNKIIETKINNRIQLKKHAILASKNF